MADRLTFWDYSRSQTLSGHNGSRVDVPELVKLGYARRRAESHEIELPSAETVADIHPLALTRPRRWEAAVRAAIYAFSGQIAVRQEIIKAREILDRLSRTERRDLSVSRMLALVPTVVSGFHFSRQHDGFNPEANRYVDGSRFLSTLLTERPVLEVDIGLCAHRNGTDSVVLPDHVSRIGARRMAAFVSALMDNSSAARRTVNVTQQTATDRAASTVNSLVFTHYAAAGEVERFLCIVDQHARDIQEVLARHNSLSDTDFRFLPLDPFSELVERDMEETFGPDWWGEPREPQWRTGGTLHAAVDDARRKMARFERNESLGLDRMLRLHKDSAKPSERGVSAIHWFDQYQRRSPLARARYYVAFNHRLAVTTLRKDGVGIGMERGWDAYQWLAWSAAYGSPRTPMPLLYARSSTEPPTHESLRSFSLRQFW